MRKKTSKVKLPKNVMLEYGVFQIRDTENAEGCITVVALDVEEAVKLYHSRFGNVRIASVTRLSSEVLVAPTLLGGRNA